jgi:8-oxo-dGTP pyrophosphatase MutT (NUDIX family)
MLAIPSLFKLPLRRRRFEKHVCRAWKLSHPGATIGSSCAMLSGREGTVGEMERYRTMRAYSAGGVVFRLVPIRSTDENNFTTNKLAGEKETPLPENTLSVEVALVGRSHAGIWTLPKGTPQSGETIEQVALREVQEETGLKVRLIAYIGSISYSFVRDQVRYQKQVRHFLMEAIGGDTSFHDQEYDLVAWFPLSEACRCLTYQNEVNILYQAEDVLQRWLERQEGKK